MKSATLFSGFGGAEIGMEAAGCTPVWGLEKDERIAGVAQRNGLPVRCGDVGEALASDLPKVDALHASPPCPNFSQAKAGGKEEREDVRMADIVADFLWQQRPKFFTLENVWGYRKSESWRRIARTLQRMGYGWAAWHQCAADYGVPQTRKRMIVAAVLEGLRPTKPPVTHAEGGGGEDLFGARLPRWRGWYGAVEDLIPTLPDDEFAQWQLDRLPEELTTLLLMTGNTSKAKGGPGVGVDDPDAPANSVLAGASGAQARAFIVDGDNAGKEGDIWHPASRPSTSVSASSAPRAFCMGSGTRSPVRLAHGPHAAVTANSNQGNSIKAYLDDGFLRGNFLVAGTPNDRGASVTTRRSEAPAMTIPATDRHARRALAQGRVVRMTPRCLARFQSFPDRYELPGGTTLACRGIGNAWPPRWAEAVWSHLLASAA